MKIRLSNKRESAAVFLLIIVAVGGMGCLGGCVARRIQEKIDKIEKQREEERRRLETNEVAAVTLPSETVIRFSGFVLASATAPVVQALPIAQWETSTNLIDWEPVEFPELNTNETKRFFRTKQ